MYVRIQDKSIRYRISRSEAKHLVDGGNISQELVLSSTHSLGYAIKMTNAHNSFDYDAQSNLFLVSINRNELILEIENRPSKKGIIFNQNTGSDSISVSVEIDIKNK